MAGEINRSLFTVRENETETASVAAIMEEATAAFDSQKYAECATALSKINNPQGNTPEADWMMGVCKYEGLGVPRDVQAGVRLIRSAAGRRHKDAMCAAGYMYFITNDIPKARLWFAAAADAGSSIAARRLADIMHASRDPEERKNAVKYWGHAASLGDTVGKCMYGSALLAGEGVEKNEVLGFFLVHDAHREGSRHATTLLAHCYNDGRGVGKDATRAAAIIDELHKRPPHTDIDPRPPIIQATVPQKHANSGVY